MAAGDGAGSWGLGGGSTCPVFNLMVLSSKSDVKRESQITGTHLVEKMNFGREGAGPTVIGIQAVAAIPNAFPPVAGWDELEGTGADC